MIPLSLKVTLSIVIICYFVGILLLLKNKSLELKYTLLWLCAGFAMVIILIFPKVLQSFMRLIGIGTYMNGLYVIWIGFIILILMALTSIVSKQMIKIKDLVQETAIMEKRIRDLEDKLLQPNIEEED